MMTMRIVVAAVRARRNTYRSRGGSGARIPRPFRSGGGQHGTNLATGVMHLWFTQELEPAFSSVTVSDKSGASVNDGPAAIDPSNKRRWTSS